MGWLNTLANKIAGVAPTDWALQSDLPDPGLSISGKPLAPDRCYVELYVESLRLAKARRFGTTFHGVIYSFASLARQGTNKAELASVTKPQNLATLGATDLDRVITMSKQIMPSMPWRGHPFGIELGLFSVKSGNVLTPLINLVTKVSDKAGLSIVTKVDPFTPLIMEGLDLIAGQTSDTELELALDTDMSPTHSQICALIAKSKDTIKKEDLSIDLSDRKLLHQGAALNAAYCVFSIRVSDRNPNWGAIPALQEAYADFIRAIGSGKHKDAEEALAAFNRQLIISPDLISADKDELKAKARADLHAAFPGGGQSATKETAQRFANRTLWDLNLYNDPPAGTRPPSTQ